MISPYISDDFSSEECSAIDWAVTLINSLLSPGDGVVDIQLADDPTDFGGMWLTDPDDLTWTIELRHGMDDRDLKETILHELIHVVQDIGGISRCELMAEGLAKIYYAAYA